MTQNSDISKIPKRKLRTLIKNEEKTALAANLYYVNDQEEGIERRKSGEKFKYYFQGKILKDDEDLVRIKGLAIPPAWTNVWICKKPNGHLQATGYDARNRKQYRYHSDWNLLRTQTKFYRMISFGKVIPQIRTTLARDLSSTELTLNKVLATVVLLIEKTNIRIGNSEYEKNNGSFGLTTLKDRHVSFSGKNVEFKFKGKKGIKHDIILKDKKLAKIILDCRDVPGRELFQYYDDEGNHHSIDSGTVNQYIKEISGADFTAKDFRTWSGTVHAFTALQKLGCCESKTEAKRKINEAIDFVSQQLGNTRAVCKSYYVHPLIISLYEENKIEKFFDAIDKTRVTPSEQMSREEKIVLQILESN